MSRNSQTTLPPAVVAEIPKPTPEISKSLLPQDLQDHRQKIASEIKVVLSAYFQPFETDEIKSAQLAWWCDELQDWTREQVVWALRKWNRERPRIRPTPGDIVAICKDARGKKCAASMPAQPPDRPKERVSRDRAAEILAEAGFSTNRFGGDA